MSEFDHKCLQICRNNNSAAVSWVIMASYAYYIEDDPILSDEVFDGLIKQLGNSFGEWATHPNAIYVTMDRIKAGSLFDVSADQYPFGLVRALHTLRKGDFNGY